MAPRRTCECGTCRKCKHREYMNAYYRRDPQKIRDIANASRARRLELAYEKADLDRKRAKEDAFVCSTDDVDESAGAKDEA